MALTFPPYGFVNRRLAPRAAGREDPPPDFLPNLSLSERLKEKSELQSSFAQEISEKFWPCYRLQPLGWHGTAVAQMEALTRDDFTLLAELQLTFDKMVTLPALGRTVGVRHADAFVTEDGHDSARPFGPFEEFRHYALVLPAVMTEQFGRLFLDGMRVKVGALSQELKARFHRPRPYQMAAMLPIADFNYALGYTATHSSLIGGHCLQGLLAGAHVDAVWRGEPLYSKSVQRAVEQYATDFGDRRVLAGVHYPSDTYITWLYCFRLLPYVMKPESVPFARAFLVNSIRTSRLWSIVSSRRDDTALSPVYRQLLSDVLHVTERSADASITT